MSFKPILKGLSHQLCLIMRRYLRLQTPDTTPPAWGANSWFAIVIAALLVALLTSLPLLSQPALSPGALALRTYVAPDDAEVIDSAAQEQRRSELGPRTLVQVIDPAASARLRDNLDQLLNELRRVVRSQDGGVPPVELSDVERDAQLRLMDRDRDAWEVAVRAALDRMIAQGLIGSLAEQDLQRASLAQLPEELPERLVAARLISRAVRGQTNLRTDPDLTKSLLEEILNKGAETIQVKQGERIVGRGQIVTSRQFDVLDHFGLTGRRPAFGPWLFRFGEGIVGSVLMVLISRRWRPAMEPSHGLALMLMLALVQAAKLWFQASSSPLAMLVPPTLLLAEGLGTATGLGWLAMAAMLWPIPLDGIGVFRLIVACLISTVAALLAGRQRSRAQLLQLAMVLTLSAVLFQAVLLQGAGLFGLPVELRSGGEFLGEGLLLAGLLLLVLNLAPALENVFGLITRARLLELADLQCPLLRRLSEEAPGTFEHTLMICGLAEEGARAIGADVDLIRTGALYHDIGKLHAPQWFIENQAGGANPHDSLNDPWKSAAVLQAHVDEGLVMARRYRLPLPLQAFIPEHQGTLRMGYFLHRAEEIDPDVCEDAFRYRGPTPQSAETGILMLADGCEAALRSLPPETDEGTACDTVRRIFDARVVDGQLSRSGLGKAELALVLRAFVRVWKRMRHRRIAYPIPRQRAINR